MGREGKDTLLGYDRAIDFPGPEMGREGKAAWLLLFQDGISGTSADLACSVISSRERGSSFVEVTPRFFNF
ncbi:hypothetical protein Amuc03_01718 [Akkermansia muciniphila]